MAYFDNLIGQEPLKRKLSFYLDAFKETKRLPFLLFCGPKGYGKTLFAKEVARNLVDADSVKPRRLLEINSSTIKNNTVFFENIFLQFIQGQSITVLWDECHNLPNDLSQALLTICNSQKEAVRSFQWGESVYDFDFTKLSFIFATTEQDQIFGPLKDRFEIVDFDHYTIDEQKQIIQLNLGTEVALDGNVIDEIVGSVRGNARSCVKTAESVLTYCKKNFRKVFGHADWKSLCHDLSIRPEGLSSSEVMVLKELQKRGPSSLNALASATGLSRSALQRDVEQYLVKKNFIRIDGKRKITSVGQKILERIEKT